jgi:epsilon-lactone hydrolase
MYAEPMAKLLSEVQRLGRRAVFLSVEYSLAPAFPFPKALHEAVAAYRYLVGPLGIAPTRIVLAGDSAGGNLAIAAALLLRDAGDRLPSALTLVSPWVSLEATTPSYRRNDATDMLSLAMLQERRAWYLHGRPPSGLTSPVLADLRGLPPALVFAGSREVFVDDITGTRTRGGSLRMARQCRIASVGWDAVDASRSSWLGI